MINLGIILGVVLIRYWKKYISIEIIGYTNSSYVRNLEDKK